MLTHALYDESVSRSIVYLASVLCLDTESLGFNAEVRGLAQFEIVILMIILLKRSEIGLLYERIPRVHCALSLIEHLFALGRLLLLLLLFYYSYYIIIIFIYFYFNLVLLLIIE